MKPAAGVQYVTDGGALTVQGFALLMDQARRIEALEAKIAAIAAVAAPAGGSVVDVQARAALAAIKAGAA